MEFMELIQNVSVLSAVTFALGMILLIIEVCTPGFGVAGGLGLICLVVDIFITAKTITQGLIMTGIVAVIVAILAVISIALISKGKLPGNLMLKESTDKESGYTGGSDKSGYLGKKGKTVTELRPAGAAELDGERLDVVSQGGFIEIGTDVEVVEVSGNIIVVKAI